MEILYVPSRALHTHINYGDVGAEGWDGRCSVGDSTAISADKRDISEKAARSRSRSASRFSARDFICSIWVSLPKHSKRRVTAYSSNRVASGNEFMMMIIHETLAFAIQMPDL